MGYDQSILRILPDEVLAFYCGVGQPFILDQIKPGESVLDVGCGTGVDTIIAAIMVGPQGKTVGIDFVPEMVQRAKQNLQITQLHNVSFELGSGENLPFASESFDCVISNGAYNLIPDKTKALQEAFRVFKACRKTYDSGSSSQWGRPRAAACGARRQWSISPTASPPSGSAAKAATGETRAAALSRTSNGMP